MEPSSTDAVGRSLLWFEGEYAVCRLDPAEPEPGWAGAGGGFHSITRTTDEFSVICEAGLVPAGVQCSRGWRLGRIEGPLPHDAIGVLASIIAPLAEAGVSVFACATFDTDYLLVQASQIDTATRALEAAGHSVRGGTFA